MTILRIEHVQLAMPPGGEADARRFYGEILGIPEVPKPAHLVHRGGCWFEKGDLKVHLGVEEDFRPARKAHPAFLVRCISVIIERLKRSGHDVIDDEPLEDFTRIYVDDPFGNRIELLEISDRP
jgi:hypothetical protein